MRYRQFFLTGRLILAVSLLIIAVLGSGCKNKIVDGFEPNPSDTLSYSTNWLWTQDGRGGGSQSKLEVRGDTIVILPVDHVHFVNIDTSVGEGLYTFNFKGNNFTFAWRISPQDSASGTGLIFQKAPGEKMALIHVKWGGFYYGWHNSGDQFRNTVDDTFSADVWHTVEISDSGHSLYILFDGRLIDFFKSGNYPVDSFFVDVVPGFIGIGNDDPSEVKYRDFSFIR